MTDTKKKMGRPRINKGYTHIRVDIETYERLKKRAGDAKLGEFLRLLSLAELNMTLDDCITQHQLDQAFAILSKVERKGMTQEDYAEHIKTGEPIVFNIPVNFGEMDKGTEKELVKEFGEEAVKEFKDFFDGKDNKQ